MTDILDRVVVAAGLPGRSEARAALRSVVCALRERLEPEEAEALRGALSGVPEVFACDRPEHSHRPAERVRDRLTEPEMVARVRSELSLPDLAAARRVTRAVLSALADDVGPEAPEEPANEVVSVGTLGRPRRGPVDDDDEG